MFDYPRHVLLACISILIVTVPALAETSYMYPVADAFIISNDPNQNFGSGTGVMVGKLTNGGDVHARIRFDGIPTGVNVESAKLRLYRTMGPGAYTLAVQIASQSWQEGTFTWNTPGSTNRRTTPNSTAAIGQTTGFVTIDVTSHVQEWADGSRNNYGFHLSASRAWELEPSNNCTFSSKEGSSQSFWPRLEITYSVADPAPDLVSVSGVPSSAEVNQPFTVTVRAENDGGETPEGNIHVVARYSDNTDSLVMDNASANWAYPLLVQAPGTRTVYTRTGATRVNTDWFTEAIQTPWPGTTAHDLAVRITPQKAGTLEVLVRTTMQRTPGSATDWLNDTSTNTSNPQEDDEQGWPCRVYTVQVTPPIGTVNITVSGPASGDRPNATILYQDNYVELHRKDEDLGTAPNGNSWSFTNVPYGSGYIVDAYYWDMWVGETAQFSLNSSSISRQINALPKRPLHIRAYYSDGSTPLPGATVRLYSWDGHRSEEHLRSTKTTGTDGRATFDSWPTTKAGGSDISFGSTTALLRSGRTRMLP